MSTFDMRGQHVTNQYNISGNVNFGSIESRIDFIEELKKLKSEIIEAKYAGVIDADIETDIQYQIQKAVEQAQKPEPIKSIILEHLEKAKGFVKSITNTDKFIKEIIKAIEVVQNLF